MATGRVAGGAEVANDRAVVTLRGVPLRSRAGAVGGLVLVRDATEIRRRDRALIGKDATIREIHHRVKNNLQTVAALLRLQGRRLDSPEARAALDEAVRRVGSIALVHERCRTRPVSASSSTRCSTAWSASCASGAGREGVRSVERVGTFGELPCRGRDTPGDGAERAAAERRRARCAPRRRPAAQARSRSLPSGPGELLVTVADDGPGLPEGTDPFAGSSLGLQIVRTLVDRASSAGRSSCTTGREAGWPRSSRSRSRAAPGTARSDLSAGGRPRPGPAGTRP